MPANALDRVKELALGAARPFEATDIDGLLLEGAERYAEEYDGRFPFMIEMRSRLVRARQAGDTFTPSQAKAVLNCLRADLRRQREHTQNGDGAAGGTPVVPVVPNGRYTVQAEGIEGHVTLMLAKPRGGEYEDGLQVASSRAGHEWVRFSFVRGQRIGLFRNARTGHERQRAALEILLRSGNWRDHGLSYARRSGRCFACGLELTEPQSLDLGVGPDCRRRLGM